MFVLKYSSFDFDKQLGDIAESVTSYHYGRKIVLKDEVATGYYKVVNVPNGLKLVITNYVINQPFAGERHQVTADYYLLHVNQVKTGVDFSVQINNREIAFDDTIYNAVFLTDSKEAFGLRGSAGACFSQLKVVIPKDWFSSQLPGVFEEALLQRYFSLQAQRLSLDVYDEEYRHLVDAVLNTEDNAYYLAVVQRLATLLTERFLCRIYAKLREKEACPSAMKNILA